MLKKRGFTLVELLVAIAITTLLFAMIGGTYIFMAQSQGNLLDKSSELFFAQEIADYLKENISKFSNINEIPNSTNGINIVQTENDPNQYNIWINKYTGTLYGPNKSGSDKEKEIFTNLKINSCVIYRDNDFIRCRLEFTNVHKDKSNHTYIFILGEIPTT